MFHLIKSIKRKVVRALVRERIVPITVSNELKEKIVMIVGATGGIGLPVAEVLALKGVTLILVARNKSTLEDAAKTLNTKVMTVNADITDDQECKNAISAALETYGRIDVVVNCAGAFSFKPLDNTPENEWDTLMNTNLKGIFHVCKSVIPSMKAQKKGCIINLGSKISRNTAVQPDRVLYATTKHAVEGFSLALRNELKQFGIRVCCLMPGTTHTFPQIGGHTYLSPYQIGQLIACMIAQEDVDFESIVFTSIKQNM